MAFSRLRKIGVILLCGGLVYGSAVWYFGLSATSLAKQCSRVIAVSITSLLYHDDKAVASALADKQYVGYEIPDKFHSPITWTMIREKIEGFELLGGSALGPLPQSPFVSESFNVPYLAALREKYQLGKAIEGAKDEYDAMVKLASWVGTRWDHGMNALPGGGMRFLPVAVLEEAAKGKRFWCEVAARMTVHAATALGWPARLVSASRDGYVWEHALAEIWSNQFKKWFLVDADYNLIYESDDIPLSAYEICHFGPELKSRGKLLVRRFAPMKPSLKEVDLLPFYRYVHIDLRNDWVSRKLRPGSPAGGDLATWWTARDDLGPVLAARIHVDKKEQFDWAVNAVQMIPLRYAGDTKEGKMRIVLALRGYSPFFKKFEYSTDGGPWITADDYSVEASLEAGAHSIKARIVTENGWNGPTYDLRYSIRP